MVAKLSNIRINEVSLVDSPANKSAKVVLMKRADDEADLDKREFSAGERKADAKSGAAESDGSFPIENSGDLHNAMRAVGRSKNPEKTRAHIRSRAAALGLSGELSDAFKKDLPETAGPAVIAESEKDINMLEGFAKALGLPAETTEEDVSKAIYTREQANKLLAAELDIAKAGMNEDEKSYHDGIEKAEDKKSFREMSREDRASKMKKHEELPEWIKKKLDNAETLEKRLAVLEERDTIVKYEKLATEMGFEVTDASLIRKAYAGDKASVDALMKMVADARTTAENAGLFSEIGSARNTSGFGNSYDELMAKAEVYRTAHPELTVAQAFEKVYTDPANIQLAKRERQENRPRAN